MSSALSPSSPLNLDRITGRAELRDVTLERGGRVVLAIKEWQFPTTAQITALIGPNGAGKSSLLRVLHGLARPTTGLIQWPHDAPPRRAMLLQAPTLLRRTVGANVDFLLKRRGLSSDRRRSEVQRLLAQARLDGTANRPARHLSGGQQRRLALAQALAQDPEMLLLDEPTAGLDPAACLELEAMIQRAAAEGVGIVMSSHELGQVRRLASHVLFLNAGKPVEHGAVLSMLDHPQTEELSSFIRGEIIC